MATVVSVIPFDIGERHYPGLFPAYFTVPNAKDKDFTVLRVPHCKHTYLPPLADRAITIDIIDNSVANSIVHDYLISCIAIEGDAKPGIFWIPGEPSESKIKLDCAKELERAKSGQKEWFLRLIRMADADYAKMGHGLSISDIQRHAASELHLTRDWNVTTEQLNILCPSCRIPVRPEAVVCSACKLILKPEEYKKLQFAV